MFLPTAPLHPGQGHTANTMQVLEDMHAILEMLEEIVHHAIQLMELNAQKRVMFIAMGNQAAKCKAQLIQDQRMLIM